MKKRRAAARTSGAAIEGEGEEGGKKKRTRKSEGKEREVEGEGEMEQDLEGTGMEGLGMDEAQKVVDMFRL